LTGTYTSAHNQADQAPDYEVTVSGAGCSVAKDSPLYYKLVDTITWDLLEILEIDYQCLDILVRDEFRKSTVLDSRAGSLVSVLVERLTKKLQSVLNANVRAVCANFARAPSWDTYEDKILIHVQVALDQDFIDSFNPDDETTFVNDVLANAKKPTSVDEPEEAPKVSRNQATNVLNKLGDLKSSTSNHDLKEEYLEKQRYLDELKKNILTKTVWDMAIESPSL